MWFFIYKTFSPEIFWTALAAIGTLLAVCTALFSPWIVKRRELVNMKKIVEYEIQENQKGLERIMSVKNQRMPSGEVLHEVNQINAICASEFCLGAWEEYKYKIAVTDPNFLKKHEEFNNSILRLINVKSTMVHPQASQEGRQIESFAAVIRKEIVKKMLTKESA